MTKIGINCICSKLSDHKPIIKPSKLKIIATHIIKKTRRKGCEMFIGEKRKTVSSIINAIISDFVTAAPIKLIASSKKLIGAAKSSYKVPLSFGK